MKLFIKNMVCIRCKMVVKEELAKLGIEYTTLELGEVDINSPLTIELHDELKKRLKEFGLDLIDDRKNVLIQRIKNIIVEMVHYADNPLPVNFSVYLSEKLNHDYTYMANIFSEVQGTTIEKFIISHKIERVKELLLYNELNLTEIADLMHYSSVAHLSAQFRKVTGLTPSCFKQLKGVRRTMLEEI
jgi:YesN/AraC family two-component response regulator